MLLGGNIEKTDWEERHYYSDAEKKVVLKYGAPYCHIGDKNSGDEDTFKNRHFTSVS